MSLLPEPRKTTVEQIASKVTPAPSSILIFGAVCTGKTVAITALKTAYKSLGQELGTRDDAPQVWFNTYDVTAYDATIELRGLEDAVQRVIDAAEAVIVFRLTWPQARAVAPCLENITGGLHIMPEELMNTPGLQAIVFTRTEPPALLALNPA